MFEDFRKQAAEADLSNENQEIQPVESSTDHEGRLLGMTPAQRFVVALLLLIMTVFLGVLFLLVNSKIVLPFFN